MLFVDISSILRMRRNHCFDRGLRHLIRTGQLVASSDCFLLHELPVRGRWSHRIRKKIAVLPAVLSRVCVGLRIEKGIVAYFRIGYLSPTTSRSTDYRATASLTSYVPSVPVSNALREAFTSRFDVRLLRAGRGWAW